MKSIKKTHIIPNALKSLSIQNAYDKNLTAKKFVTGKSHYQKVYNELYELYGGKCAYCESDYADQIEHYRPLSKYYQLAFSWDNLLLSCSKCNQNKSGKFEIRNAKHTYSNSLVSKMQNLISDFDKKEEPLMLNPEQISEEIINEHFTFDLDKKILVSLTEEMEYTINTCKLNRDVLIEKRKIILAELKELFLSFGLNITKISNFIEYKISNNHGHTAWLKYILNQIKKLKP